MRENLYQAQLIRRLKQEFPGCVVEKNDSGYRQGTPDLTIFFGTRWAKLEVKGSENAPNQPNQPYWVDLFNEMSYAAFIFPENEDEVFRELHSAIGEPDRRPARNLEPLESGLGKLRRR